MGSDVSEFDDRLINSAALLGTATDATSLWEMTDKLVSLYLQHPDDAEVRVQTQTQTRAFLKSGAPMEVLRQFSVQVIRVILASRPVEYYAEMLYAPEVDEDYSAGGEELHHAPTEILAPPVPQPVTCNSFEELLPEALCYRVRLLTGFFQRRNPLIARGVRVPFLLSPVFEQRFCQVIREVITPRMLGGKNLGALANARNWKGVDSAAFWNRADLREIASKTIIAWESIWRRLYQITSPAHEIEEAAQSAEALKLRAKYAELLTDIQMRLNGPEYVMPKLGPSQLKMFQTSFASFDRRVMEQVWKSLRQTYEQELDRRPYQEKARHGALRDNFLASFDLCTHGIGEMLVILGYFSFPKLPLHWVELFSFNMGNSRENRMELIPVLTAFLEQEDAQRAYKREPPELLAEIEASAVITA